MPQSENKKETPIEEIKLEMADLSERVETIKNDITSQTPQPIPDINDIKQNINTYGSWIYQGVAKVNSSVPTHKPKNREEQFYLYESGATIRLYIWVNGTWRYITLT